MNLAELRAIGTEIQARPTMSHAQLSAITNRQERALVVALTEGCVLRGGAVDQASISTLNALARKGLMRLTAHPGTRRSNWAYGELTKLGHLAAESVK